MKTSFKNEDDFMESHATARRAKAEVRAGPWLSARFAPCPETRHLTRWSDAEIMVALGILLGHSAVHTQMLLHRPSMQEAKLQHEAIALRLEDIASRLEAFDRNNKLLGTSASLLVTGALLVVARSY